MTDSDLTLLRRQVAAEIEAAGVSALEYVAEVIDPPCAVVVPSEPYLLWGRSRRGEPLPFASMVSAGMDVLVIGHRDTSALSAAAIDDQITVIVRALSEAGRTIVDVAQPGHVTLSGAKFLGSVVRIEEITKEP